jgi:hypothetical protein
VRVVGRARPAVGCVATEARPALVSPASTSRSD